MQADSAAISPARPAYPAADRMVTITPASTSVRPLSMPASASPQMGISRVPGCLAAQGCSPGPPAAVTEPPEAPGLWGSRRGSGTSPQRG